MGRHRYCALGVLRLAFLPIAPCSLGLAALFALAGISIRAKDTLLAMEVEWAGRDTQPRALLTGLAAAPRPTG